MAFADPIVIALYPRSSAIDANRDFICVKLSEQAAQVVAFMTPDLPNDRSFATLQAVITQELKGSGLLANGCGYPLMR